MTMPLTLKVQTAQQLGRLLVPVLAVVVLLPAVSPGLGLLLGLAVGLTVGNPWLPVTRQWTSRLLQLSVIGLGAGMNLIAVARAGLAGVGYTAVGITLTLGLGVLLGRWLKVGQGTSLLVAVGTAICGGSAIAAVAPIIGSREDETSAALACVFLLNALALFLFPALGTALGFDAHQFGLLSALAIHDTSSVVGAAATFGEEALAVATSVKLARALWIVPVGMGIGAWVARRRGQAGTVQAKRPWFIAGFLAAAALVTFVPVLQPAGEVVSLVARRLLVLTLFLIGASLTRTAVRQVGVRPFLQGTLLWVFVTAATAGALVLGLIR